ncbi:protein kinase domain-containing protein [Cryptosporidium andersoni]|uniref:non-specific serine/threonine protein kinase n=1 Tax=Cryptosporidium andersoni TaxID=117008 RepID=A0A1J4MTX6_9CRYT|nr:protein kinase domain-containing protein [Cryptosporidium andersoni]
MTLLIPLLPRNSSFDFLYKNYRIIEYVGRGQFGNTYKVQNTIDNKIWLAKCIDLSQMDEDDKNRSLQEAEIMKTINNPYVIKCHESFIHDDIYLIIIMEYCKQGDISKVLENCIKTNTYLSEDTVLFWCSQIAAGLHYLHRECSIIHRDIKPSNIFLTDKGNIVIGDFGISRIMLSVTIPYTLTSIGTPQYMSPEMCENKPYTYKSDIWSFGCVMYELTCLKPPFTGDSLLSLAWNISFQKIEPPPKCYSNELFNLVQQLLSRNSSLRPDPFEILQTPLLRVYKEKLLYTPKNEIIVNPKTKRMNEISLMGKMIDKNKIKQIFNKEELIISKQQDDDLIDYQYDISVKTDDTYPSTNSMSLTSYSSYIEERSISLESINLGFIPNNFVYEDINKCCRQDKEKFCITPTNFDQQYCSIIVGRIQQYIFFRIEEWSLKSPNNLSIYEIIEYLNKNTKCCNKYIIENIRISSKWLAEFVLELDIGISEAEQELLLSYISYTSLVKIDNFNISRTIRYAKSSDSLNTLDESNLIGNKKIRRQSMPNNDSKYKNFQKYIRNENLNTSFDKLPIIHEFLEYIIGWNGIIRNNINNLDMTEIKYNEVYKKEEEKLPSNSMGIFSLHLIKPDFYHLIKDWIGSIIKPAALNKKSAFHNSISPKKKIKSICLKDGFRLFDQSKHEILSRQHFRTVLYLILPKLTSIQLDWLFALAPKDSNGNVKYEQFLEYVTYILQNEKEMNNSQTTKFEDKESNNHTNSIFPKRDSGHYSYKVVNTNNCYSLFIDGTIDNYLYDDDNTHNNNTDFFGYGIHDLVLLHHNNQTCRRPSPSPQIISRTRTASNLRNPEELITENFDNNLELNNTNYKSLGTNLSGLFSANRSKFNVSSSPSNKDNNYDLKIGTNYYVNDNENTEIGGDYELNNDNKQFISSGTVKTPLSCKSCINHFSISPSSPPVSSHSIDTSCLSTNVCETGNCQPGKSSIINNCFLLLSISICLEKLIQTLQLERLYTCWTTSNISHNHSLLRYKALEKLENIRIETSSALHNLTSYLLRYLKGNPEKGLDFECDQFCTSLKETLLRLEVELPLQRDAIDCMLRIFTDLIQDQTDSSLSQTIQASNKVAFINDDKQLNEESIIPNYSSNVYREIVKQAITQNLVYPISKKSFDSEDSVNIKIKSNKNVSNQSSNSTSKYINNNSIDEFYSIEDSQSSFSSLNNCDDEEYYNLKTISLPNRKKQGSSDSTTSSPSSKALAWTGKFLASLEFFGEATVNFLQCAFQILSIIVQILSKDEFCHRNVLLYNPNTIIENYRQWSYLKEHVSRECAFVVSIGVDYDLKKDLETARIFLELLGARRYQAATTWQLQSTSERNLFKDLLLLEEALWNNSQYKQYNGNYNNQNSADDWLQKGDETCTALHSSCINFISEIRDMIYKLY